MRVLRVCERFRRRVEGLGVLPPYQGLSGMFRWIDLLMLRLVAKGTSTF
jgi:hypothetical protein